MGQYAYLIHTVIFAFFFFGLFFEQIRRDTRLLGCYLSGFAVFALFSSVYFSRLSVFDVSTWTHLHDFFHYFMGARYYAEIQNTGLYECTLKAFIVLFNQGHEVPQVQLIRDLTQIYEFKTPAMPLLCEVEGERWVSYVNDIRVFTIVNSESSFWQRLLIDLGNNPPPSWYVMNSPLANILSFSPNSIHIIALSDIVLSVVVLPLLVRYLFGFSAAMCFVIIYHCIAVAPIGWTVGSFGRYYWLLFAILAFYFFESSKFGPASIFITLSATMRIFPGAFGVVMLLTLFFKKEYQAINKFVVTGAVVAVLLIALSSLQNSFGVWLAYFEVLSDRVALMHSNSIGFGKLIFMLGVEEVPNFNGPNGLKALHQWIGSQGELPWFMQSIFIVFKLAIVILAAHLLKVKRDIRRMLLLALVLIFMFANSLTYYYSFVALYALLVWKDSKVISVLPVFGLMLLLQIASIPFWADLGIYFGFFKSAFYASALILLFIVFEVLLGYQAVWLPWCVDRFPRIAEKLQRLCVSLS